MSNLFPLSLVTILLCFSISTAWAQELNEDPARPSLGKTGQVFTVKFVPGSSRLEVSFTDSPLVTLDPERLTVLGNVIAKEGNRKSLRIRASGSNLELLDKLDPGSTVELQLKDKVTKKSETLRVSQPPKP